MKTVLKTLLVILGLKPRTIRNRLGWKSEMVRPLCPTSPFSQKLMKDHKALFYRYSVRIRQVSLGDEDSVYVLGRRFSLAFFLKDGSIDKDDYLYVYTFFYLDFDISELRSDSVTAITESMISKEPFVLSQQIFNLISEYDYIVDLDLHDYLYHQYILLCQSIEYHVDGNHVIENLMSICLFEIYFMDNSSNIKRLITELSRQTDEAGHLERNTKYTYDILLKLSVISCLLDRKSIKHGLDIYIDRLKGSLEVFYHASFFGHDNVVGDGLSEAIAKFLDISPQWSKREMLSVRTANGMSGHSFDCHNFAPIPANIRCFGTYHYANTMKRRFQRKRINNSQLCLSKSDQSVWFWKSFRVLFKLPAISFNTRSSKFQMEFVISGSRLRVLCYSWKRLRNGWVYESSSELLYKVYVDESPQIIQNHIICGNFQFIVSPGSVVSLKPTVRASALGVLVKTYSLMMCSKSITLIES